MGAKEDIKNHGLPSVKYVYTHANVTKNTFFNWYNNNRQLFYVVVSGVKSLKEKGEIK